MALADYDVDGFLDLFVTNGLNMLPEAPYTTRGGPDKLFHNAGNTNKWIELDLVGTTSNRDGVGAKVYATAGTVTQLREQNGGYHRWTQNQQRIHFGLAANTTVNLHIEWPSGVVDDYSNVPANHLYKVTEGIGYQETVLVSSSSVPCGAPTYSPGTEAAVFVWKNCTTGIWSMRVTACGGSKTYNGSVDSSQPFSTVTPVSVEANDTLNHTTASEPDRLWPDDDQHLSGWIRFQLPGLCRCVFQREPPCRCDGVCRWRTDSSRGVIQFGNLGGMFNL